MMEQQVCLLKEQVAELVVAAAEWERIAKVNLAALAASTERVSFLEAMMQEIQDYACKMKKERDEDFGDLALETIVSMADTAFLRDSDSKHYEATEKTRQDYKVQAASSADQAGTGVVAAHLAVNQEEQGFNSPVPDQTERTAQERKPE